MLNLDPWYYGILVSPRYVGGNQCLLNYWRRHICIVRSWFLSKLLNGLTRFPYLVYDARILAINETAPQIAVEREWGARPPLLTLTDEHQRRGRAWLAKIKLPRGAEFVCIHNREAGYASHEDPLQAYRDGNIENYLLAAAELTKQGFWCLRMGSPSSRRLPEIEGVIDYAHHEDRSDWLDVFLCAECKFFLGGSSGLVFVPNLFGKACAPTNQAPLSSVLAFSAADIAIPKLLWWDKEQRYLTFREAFGSTVGNFRFTNLYTQAGVRTVENTPDEVRDLALEMLDSLQGKARYTAEDERLQEKFRSLLRPGHYGYGGINRVGRDFLRKYAHLLDG